MLRFLTKEPLRGAAILSGIVSLVKIIAYIHSGSLIVLWSLLDSIGDSVISLINFRVEKLSNSDPDSQHPFGHGGFEVVSGLIQAVVITASASFVAISAIERVWGSHSSPHNLEEAIVVMIAAALVGLGIGLFLSRGQQSLATETDKAHYLADFWVNLLSAIGLAIVFFTGFDLIDALFAIAAALLAVKQVFPIYRIAYESIVQKELSVEIQQTIVDKALSTHPLVKGIHRLRSRRHGSAAYVDFHLVLPNDIELKEAHSVCDKVEQSIKDIYQDMDILIHIDPEGHPRESDWVPSYQE